MLATTMDSQPAPGRTFVYWLSQACKAAREAGGLNQADIPINQPRVSRFEKHAKWPDDPEGLVQAYAQALGIKDSRQLWNLALDWWIEHGQPPTRIEPRRVPGIPEGELLQRLRADLPSGRDREQHMTSLGDSQAESG